MKHILTKPIRITVPKPSVFVATLLSAILSVMFRGYAVAWHINPFWGYLAAAVCGMWLAHLAWQCARFVSRFLSRAK